MAAGHPNLFLLVPEGRSAGAAFRLRLPWERPERRGRHGGGEASAAQARPDAGELAEGSRQSVSRDPPEQVLLIAAKGDRVIAAVKLYPIAKRQEEAGDNLSISVLPEKNEAVASSYKLKDTLKIWSSTSIFFLEQLTADDLCIVTQQFTAITGFLIPIKTIFGHERQEYKGFLSDREVFFPFNVTKVANFKVIDNIGQGAEGLVERCSLQLPGFYGCAVKNKSHEISTTLPREVEILTLLSQCDNVVQLYLACAEFPPSSRVVGKLCIAMDLHQGSLENFLQGKLDDLDREKIFRQIVAGVQEIHNLEIIHRDLKPGNILLDDNLSIFIADFGCAIITDSSMPHVGGTTCGTKFYCAPELDGPLRRSTKMTDIYSIGVIYFELYLASPDKRYIMVKQFSEKMLHGIRTRKPNFIWRTQSLWKDWEGDLNLLQRMACAGSRLSAREILMKLEGHEERGSSDEDSD